MSSFRMIVDVCGPNHLKTWQKCPGFKCLWIQPFENRTIQQPDMFGPFENRTCTVFECPIVIIKAGVPDWYLNNRIKNSSLLFFFAGICGQIIFGVRLDICARARGSNGSREKRWASRTVSNQVPILRKINRSIARCVASLLSKPKVCKITTLGLSMQGWCPGLPQVRLARKIGGYIHNGIASWLVCPKECRQHNYIYTIFTTVPFQVQSITSEIIPLQCGSVFYEHAKLTGALNKHRVNSVNFSYYANT